MDSGASIWLPPPSISLDSLSLSLFLTVMATEKYVWALCVYRNGRRSEHLVDHTGLVLT